MGETNPFTFEGVDRPAARPMSDFETLCVVAGVRVLKLPQDVILSGETSEESRVIGEEQ